MNNHKLSSVSSPSPDKPLLKFSVKQPTLNLHESASPDSSVIVVLNEGDYFYLLEDLHQEIEDWLRVRTLSGTEGFIRSDEKAEPVFRDRFRIERIAFIVVGSIIGGLTISPHSETLFGSNISTIGIIVIIALFSMGAYFTTNYLLGIGGFFEKLPSESIIPPFDWGRFLREPLFLVVIIVALFICVLIYGAIVKIIR